MTCQRCGGDPKRDDVAGCICGDANFEIGGIFAAHSMARLQAQRGDTEALEKAIAHLADRIDEAERQVNRRSIERRTANRGRA